MGKWIVIKRKVKRIILNADHIGSVFVGASATSPNVIKFFGPISPSMDYATIQSLEFKSEKSCFYTALLIQNFLASPDSLTLEINMEISGNLE